MKELEVENQQGSTKNMTNHKYQMRGTKKHRVWERGYTQP